MTSRERMIKTFTFDNPDKMPVVYHPSPAGLYVHGEKLLELFREYPPDNPIAFDGIPQPDPGTVRDGVYEQVKRDQWGTVWEYRVFGIQGIAREVPLADWAALDAYEFPQPPDPRSPRAQRERESNETKKEQYLLFGGGLSIFERILALRPMDDVLMELCTRDPRLMELLDRMTEYMVRTALYLVSVGNDVVMFGDDWGMQNGPILSPRMFREIFRPRYERIFEQIKKAGRRIFFHSCGALGPIFDELADMGIDGIWHQVNRYDEEEFALRCRDRRITAYLHPDRQHLVPLGTPAQIRTQIRRYADIYHGMGGGGIFYIEMENDAPFDNVRALIEAVHEFR